MYISFSNNLNWSSLKSYWKINRFFVWGFPLYITTVFCGSIFNSFIHKLCIYVIYFMYTTIYCILLHTHHIYVWIIRIFASMHILYIYIVVWYVCVYYQIGMYILRVVYNILKYLYKDISSNPNVLYK